MKQVIVDKEVKKKPDGWSAEDNKKARALADRLRLGMGVSHRGGMTARRLKRAEKALARKTKVKK